MSITTERLLLRLLTPEDAPFILRLLNEPSWLEFIGDRGVRSLDDAQRYIQEGPLATFAAHGYGLYAVTRKAGGAPIGLCGLLRRDFLAEADLGFAFLPEMWGQGFAHEAAAGVIAHAREHLGMGRLLAITALENPRSTRLLAKLGFHETGTLRYPSGERVRLFAHDEPLGRPSLAPEGGNPLLEGQGG